MEEPGGKRNLIIKINAQHNVRNVLLWQLFYVRYAGH